MNRNIRYAGAPYVIVLLMLCGNGYAQKRWTGSYGTAWANAQNWQPAGVPGINDDVVLDNATLPSDYSVVLPDTAVAIRSLVIAPGAGHHVLLVLPATNLASPALRIAATGDAIVIGNGGTFINSSGLGSGSSLAMAGALRLEQSGRYVHNTRSAHAADIVARLSSAAGTEEGVLEFDVPGGSYPLSLSNRTYGRLVLSAAASGGTQTYNASGTNPLLINDNLEINAGVVFNLDFTRDLTINGSLVQKGGTFNIASQPNSNTVKVKGGISQLAGVITETSTGLPVIELAGSLRQQVLLNGAVTGSVTLRMNDPGGAELAGPVSLAFRLELLNGKINSTGTSLLTLADNCQVTGASVQSFIDGPLRKMGDDDFEFPVGKQGDYAPVTISGTAGSVTDAFQAEYFLGNPQTAYGPAYETPAIRRVSTLEYWKVERVAGASAKKVTLSAGPYSNATALDKLVVSCWNAAAATWMNAGNTSYNGIATGTVTSTLLGDFGGFTLASTVEYQNPLPLPATALTASRQNGSICLNWEVPGHADTLRVEVDRSADGTRFNTIGSMAIAPGTTRFSFFTNDTGLPVFYRMRVVGANGTAYSSIARLTGTVPVLTGIYIRQAAWGRAAVVALSQEREEWLQCCIRDQGGRERWCVQQHVDQGAAAFTIGLPDLTPGLYLLTITGSKSSPRSIRFYQQ